MSLCNEEACLGKPTWPDGQLHVCWSFLKTDTDSGDWLRDHELVGDKLEFALCEKLQETLFSEDELAPLNGDMSMTGYWRISVSS